MLIDVNFCNSLTSSNSCSLKGRSFMYQLLRRSLLSSLFISVPPKHNDTRSKSQFLPHGAVSTVVLAKPSLSLWWSTSAGRRLKPVINTIGCPNTLKGHISYIKPVHDTQTRPICSSCRTILQPLPNRTLTSTLCISVSKTNRALTFTF